MRYWRGSARTASLGGERDHRALGAPRDRAADMGERRAARAGRQDEFLEPRQARRCSAPAPRRAAPTAVGLQQLVARDRQLAAEVEELVLDRRRAARARRRAAARRAARRGSSSARRRRRARRCAGGPSARGCRRRGRSCRRRRCGSRSGSGGSPWSAMLAARLEARRQRAARRLLEWPHRAASRRGDPAAMNAPLPARPAARASQPRPVPAAMLDALKARFGERCSTALAVREQHGRDESPFDAPPPDGGGVLREHARTSPTPSRCAERARGAGDSRSASARRSRATCSPCRAASASTCRA